jgi:23S rRNA (guanosine2251-2'-O)-methyltransferase
MAASRSPSSQPVAEGGPTGGGKLWFYGRHAVEAALKNPRRTCHQLLATDEALERLASDAQNRAPDIRRVDRADLDAKLGEHVVHQGLALAVAPLPSLSLERACGTAGAPASVDLPSAADADTNPSQGRTATVLVLDRINDPHNLGAILRSAVAFGARAVIVPHRQSAELGGATAKAASGALDMIPIVEVTNLARTLDALKEMGYWRAGLDGRALQTLDEAPTFEKLALVLGAEGTGIRRLVAEHCDLTVRLPIREEMESLNVSVACGIALYALARKG